MQVKLPNTQSEMFSKLFTKAFRLAEHCSEHSQEQTMKALADVQCVVNLMIRAGFICPKKMQDYLVLATADFAENHADLHKRCIELELKNGNPDNC
jgi:hypothetical protein